MKRCVTVLETFLLYLWIILIYAFGDNGLDNLKDLKAKMRN